MHLQKEREAFEAWFIENGIPIDTDFNVAKRAFEAGAAWQAAKAIPDGYKVVPVNYECAWCGCTELDGLTDETMIEAQEQAND